MVSDMTQDTAAETEQSGEMIEAEGSTLEEAIANALTKLGVTRDEAEVEVVSSGTRRIPGEQLSATGARVRVYRIDEHAMRARALLEELLTRMEVPCRVTVRRGGLSASGAPAPVILDISGDDLGLLIGWRGETLRSLQTALNLMLGEDEEGAGRRVVLDVERYRARREDQVRELALRLAIRVKRSGERYTLDPMHAYERRVVHMTLANDSDVRTESSGREPARRVVIHPTGPAQGGPIERAPGGPRRGPTFGHRR
ncbi:MAG: protein jag [Candidatus Dormibacteraeota bacterium]|nr:protein jag [Candidatus Dormibacteraeota bacterium]